MNRRQQIITTLFILLSPFSGISQVGIGTTSPAALLDIRSSSQGSPSVTDGILIPKMDMLPTQIPTVDQDGLLVYITGNGSLSSGFYFWSGDIGSWALAADSNGPVKKINDLSDGKSDNDGTDNGSSVFLGIQAGITDDRTDNQNVGLGYHALSSNTEGSQNIGIGYNALTMNIDGNQNVGMGYSALTMNTEGNQNIGIGYNALSSNTIGNHNIGIGYQALRDITTEDGNVAIGYQALLFNTADANSSLGHRSLEGNTSGAFNSAVGYQALNGNTEGNANVGMGYLSLFRNDNGNDNIGLGNNALYSNLSGNNNTALGSSSGFFASGSGNVFLGYKAGYNEAGSNLLYIENSDSSTPLIWGDFTSNHVVVNGQLEVNGALGVIGAYEFPTNDGLSGQVLTTDGNGIVSFGDIPIPSGWSTNGNSGTTNGTDFLGTTDAQDLDIRTNNIVHHRFTQQGQLEFLNTGNSVFIGSGAGSNDDLTNNANTMVGTNAGLLNTSGASNTLIGVGAGFSNNGNANSFFGSGSGQLNNAGNENCFFGQNSGFFNMTGSNNSFFGQGSGSNASGSGNVFLGYQAGQTETGDNLLYIENSNAPIPLIWGDFANDRLGINRIATTNSLEVEGEASKATPGSWLANSDRRLKKNIVSLEGEDILNKIMQLRGVSYEWNDNKTNTSRPIGIQYGFIAQELMDVFPEKITTDKLGFYQTAYGDYDAFFVEAIKELKKEIDRKDEKIKLLENRLYQIEKLLLQPKHTVDSK